MTWKKKPTIKKSNLNIKIILITYFNIYLFLMNKMKY